MRKALGSNPSVSILRKASMSPIYPTGAQDASAGNRTRVTSMATMYSATRPLMLLKDRWPLPPPGLSHRYCSQVSLAQMDTLGIEPRASRMLSGCDTTTPCARWCKRGATILCCKTNLYICSTCYMCTKRSITNTTAHVTRVSPPEPHHDRCPTPLNEHTRTCPGSHYSVFGNVRCVFRLTDIHSSCV